MVKTPSDVMDMNTNHRISELEDIANEKKHHIDSKKKELEEYEKKKQKELDDLDKKKKKDLEELESKRKELKDLESQKNKEIEDAKKLIDHSLQEIVRHKKILSDEEDKNSKSKKSIDEFADADNVPVFKGKNLHYGQVFEDMAAPKSVYNVTNHEFYSNLIRLQEKSLSGEITPQEQMFVEDLKSRLGQFSSNDSYVDKDKNNYIQRSMNLIEQIGKYNRLKD